jgi:uncharacterized protein DUF262
VQHLERYFARISFPEYQREPNIWSRVEKQRLIDSMLRQFDIASFYFYEDADGSIECIDGRQRIGAIMSFLGENLEDSDNGFEFKVLNEIYKDEEHPFASVDGFTFTRLVQESQAIEAAGRLVKEFREYLLTIVKLTGSRRAEEFSLQFTRLNLGIIINSGEKLHAMVGELRDACFEDIGQHPFLALTRLPTRRYSRQQVAAQILAQVFSVEETGEFTRTRHFDLQRLFKEHRTLTEKQKAWIERTRTILNLLKVAFDDLSILRNRAITVSTVLLALRQRITKREEAHELALFVKEFLRYLQWQLAKGLDVDAEYRYLIDFQRHVTQASVEKPAVEARHKTLEKEFSHWRESHSLTGDDEYRRHTGKDPGAV